MRWPRKWGRLEQPSSSMKVASYKKEIFWSNRRPRCSESGKPIIRNSAKRITLIRWLRVVVQAISSSSQSKPEISAQEYQFRKRRTTNWTDMAVCWNSSPKEVELCLWSSKEHPPWMLTRTTNRNSMPRRSLQCRTSCQLLSPKTMLNWLDWSERKRKSSTQSFPSSSTQSIKDQPTSSCLDSTNDR